jgi:hypothetical protein
MDGKEGAVNAREKALAKLGEAWTDWNLNHVHDAPFFPEDSAPHKGFEDQSDYSMLRLDRSATATMETELWDAQKKGREALAKLRAS